ncbi:hypothetical protein B0181_04525 [Moraxella caviae]|uniref:DUF4377 domain-containing protein n=1 Tax=Moraxella caviae TaxID=34060 RepID=A0A1T0A5S4_9GAMM|nr:DUF4377 domain-containing protein [Moraxella caviae]OOR90691.1 hypothetical protein B0181_04525 [Moraxella caviae]STZ14834.1 Uncharacterised protein [Moraxella caviae]VEW11273.1 Uncharacterised protein [Moraxella caviae]
MKYNLTTFRLPLMAILAAATLGLSACQTTAPVPQPRYIPDIALGEAVALEILPTRTSCDSAAPMQCLQVQKAGSSEVFGIGYNDIKGFSPRTGVRYQIIARPEIDKNTNQATGEWQLDEILMQQPVR